MSYMFVSTTALYITLAALMKHALHPTWRLEMEVHVTHLALLRS